MNDKDLKKLADLVDERITKAVVPMLERLDGLDNRIGSLDDPDTGLKRINEKLDANTESIVNIEQTIKAYSDMYKMNNNNIIKLDKRMNIAEEELGIDTPEELVLGEVR